jgi:hypothetical protein
MLCLYDTGEAMLSCRALEVARDPDHRVVVTIKLLAGPRKGEQLHVLGRFVVPYDIAKDHPDTIYNWSRLVPQVGDKAKPVKP